MKKLTILSLLILACFAVQLIRCTTPAKGGTAGVHAKVTKDIRAFEAFIEDSLLKAVAAEPRSAATREAFLRSRLLYKQMEWAIAYFMPVTNAALNGAPLPEIENEENKIREPEGLQVIEGLLFSDSIDRDELQRHVKLLLANTRHASGFWEDMSMDTSHVWDAAKLEIFRVTTLGISGFDAALSRNSMREAATALRSVKEVMYLMAKEDQLNKHFQDAIDYLKAFPEFETFDRLSFIKKYSNPLSSALNVLQQKMDIAYIKDDRLLRAGAPTLFDRDAFNPNAYTADSNYYFTEAKAILGERLFYDNILSRNGESSCASCHQPQKAFTDGLATSVGLGGVAIKRNAPTLLNAALQPSQFYDMRTTNLENQSLDVISNKDEMHGNLDEALKKVVTDDGYSAMLKKAFPGMEQPGALQLQNALGSYVRKLTLMNSRFDRYMRDEPYATLSEEEKEGFNLFMGKAACGTCHFMPLFNGTVPPAFLEMESEVIGVPADREAKALDTDPGRFAIYKLDPYLHAFKTTTVRNAARTAPYMHNGVFTSLGEVLDFYNKGGGAGMGLRVDNQTLSPDPLNLSQKELRSIEAFIKSLDDEWVSK